MNPVVTVFKRELTRYFATPKAIVFIALFLMLNGLFTFYLGHFFESRQADLHVFFIFHPWLYVLFAPAVSMHLWAEERQSGTLELLLTLPVTLGEVIAGKFLAAWLFMGFALMLTFPIWLTVNYLGHPDNRVILAGYLVSWLMAGGFLAIGSCMSALTKHQVVAFMLTVMMCFLLTVIGWPAVLDVFSAWLPKRLLSHLASLSFLTHFNAISKGVLDLRDLLYFLIMILAWLFATAIVIDRKKAD